MEERGVVNVTRTGKSFTVELDEFEAAIIQSVLGRCKGLMREDHFPDEHARFYTRELYKALRDCPPTVVVPRGIRKKKKKEEKAK